MAKQKDTTQQAAPEVSGVNLSEIESLLQFMEKHGLEEFEYQRGDLHIRLRKAAAGGGAYRAVAAGPDIVIAERPSSASGSRAPAEPAPSDAGKAKESGSEAAGRGDDLHVIKSPIVGTFYASPTPGAPPFVKAGDRVEQGQVLCIIEAMKLMNEIEAEVAGEVIRILVENGQPVEYGEPLFGIHPHRKK
ncbi:MAG: acetyl-CoA carboxylase biotin carboxyl carrier protein [Candidatus Acidiferrales bacterium]|jgi:acetyl-CoA carboxylase biotin carboxyl carrier protein